jgi:hypothetical protein
MTLMCAGLVSEWRFEVANVFALFRERSFQKDTIPKPGGLGFASALRVVAVQLLSSICPPFVPVLSTFCPARFWALEQ